MAVSASRRRPRLAAVPSHADHDKTGTATPADGRTAKLTARLRPASVEALRRHLREITETTGARPTIEDVLAAGVGMFFVATGKTPPTVELQAAVRPYVSNLRRPEARKAAAACAKANFPKSDPEPT